MSATDTTARGPTRPGQPDQAGAAPPIRLGRDDAEVAAFAVAEAIRRRRQAGRPIPERLRQADAALTAAMASRGHETDSASVDFISTTEAARRLGISPRTVRRQARHLGGQLHGGRLLIPATVLAD